MDGEGKVILKLNEHQCRIIEKAVNDYMDVLYHVSYEMLNEESVYADDILNQIYIAMEDSKND